MPRRRGLRRRIENEEMGTRGEIYGEE